MHYRIEANEFESLVDLTVDTQIDIDYEIAQDIENEMGWSCEHYDDKGYTRFYRRVPRAPLPELRQAIFAMAEKIVAIRAEYPAIGEEGEI